ncbi:MAG: cytochrome c3 family protein [Blastocatellia bacterium]|nr:cytochrome c3 family protein [Blastocatellia bacterium]MBL8193702.1 cytochrome c3 family protein [Blastocatellia bacterium]MBN8722721.1 cytochrome c3 family protein [Acidobacteriota bacterium]
MAQIFHRSFNNIAKISIVGLVLLLATIGGVVNVIIIRSSYLTQTQVAIEQPIQFSHKHHVGGLGLDCRYCHTSVEDAAFAGIPPTRTCMNCHSQIWVTSPMLEPVRTSFETGKPLVWKRVHNLADFAYFNHSIHVNKGVGCSTCHGRVDEMPLMWKENTLQMEWCLSCHRNPEKILRPKEDIFKMDWEPPADQEVKGRELAKQYNIQGKELLTSCSTCHR